jgi:glycosyltransferase involved in cell wall biosynthesis
VRHVATQQDGGMVGHLLCFLSAFGSSLKALATDRPGVVHAHASTRSGFMRESALLAMFRMAGTRTVLQLHGGVADWLALDGGGIPSHWIRRSLASSDTVVVATLSAAAWVRRVAPQARVRVIGDPVKLPVPRIDPQARAALRAQGHVLFLGTIHESDGIVDLFRAWKLFRQDHPGWRLVVGGDGDIHHFLEEADRLGITSDVDLLGCVGDELKEHHLRQADIFVRPSLRPSASEGLPLGVLDAMAYGVAVATTPVGDVADVMEPDVHGLWFKPGDVTDLADSLRRLADYPSLRQRLAESAHERVARDHGVDAVLQRLLALYVQLLR